MPDLANQHPHARRNPSPTDSSHARPDSPPCWAANRSFCTFRWELRWLWTCGPNCTCSCQARLNHRPNAAAGAGRRGAGCLCVGEATDGRGVACGPRWDQCCSWTSPGSSRLVCGVLSQHMAEKSGDIHGRRTTEKTAVTRRAPLLVRRATVVGQAGGQHFNLGSAREPHRHLSIETSPSGCSSHGP